MKLTTWNEREAYAETGKQVYAVVDWTNFDCEEDIFTEKDEAIRAAYYDWDHLLASEQAKRDSFCVMVGYLDDDGCFDTNEADMVVDFLRPDFETVVVEGEIDDETYRAYNCTAEINGQRCNSVVFIGKACDGNRFEVVGVLPSTSLNYLPEHGYFDMEAWESLGIISDAKHLVDSILVGDFRKPLSYYADL